MELTFQERFDALRDKSLMVLDDDAPFRNRLVTAMARRGFDPVPAGSVREARESLKQAPPAFAIVDLRLEDGSGLSVVEALYQLRPDARAVVLTGYGNIATAVAAVKAGAVDYLPKPADPDEIVKVLIEGGQRNVDTPDTPMSADRIWWEHIQRIYELCDHNVSETARQLNMHRRTLQRILAKRAPK